MKDALGQVIVKGDKFIRLVPPGKNKQVDIRVVDKITQERINNKVRPDKIIVVTKLIEEPKFGGEVV